MTPKHTPGPFESHDTPNWYAFESRLYEVTGKDGLIVAFVKDWHDAPQESRENARLFSAAPDLLTQAQKHLDWLSKLEDWTGVADDPDIEGLRAAIAKATGEQPT